MAAASIVGSYGAKGWTRRTMGCAACVELEWRGKPGQLASTAKALWSRRQESNLYLALRRRSFYPLNYGEGIDSSH